MNLKIWLTILAIETAITFLIVVYSGIRYLCFTCYARKQYGNNDFTALIPTDQRLISFIKEMSVLMRIIKIAIFVLFWGVLIVLILYLHKILYG